MQSFYLLNSIKTNTRFKGKSSYMDLINTNRRYCFKYSFTFEACLSDHHQLICSMLKKIKNKNIYHDYKKLNDINFRKNLQNKLKECPKHYKNFEKESLNVLDAHTPSKTKFDS